MRWAHRFAAVNVALLMIVGLGYLWRYSPVGVVGWVYAAIAYLGHLAVLAYVPLVLVLVPAAMLIPRPRVVLPLGVVLTAVGVSLAAPRQPALRPEPLPPERRDVHPARPADVRLSRALLLRGPGHRGHAGGPDLAAHRARRGERIGLYVALGLAGCFVASHLVFAWAEARYYMPVTAFTRYLPLYYPLNARHIQLRLGLLDRSQAHEQAVVSSLGRPPDGVLNYPLAPLACAPRAPLLNVLFVVIDAMRADALTPEVAPRLAEFARGAVRFDRHYSGGNASRPGVFSLFYGLPAPYWDAFADAVRPPVVMEMFRQHDYQLGAFVSSAVYTGIGLDRTALARVPNLRLRTYSPYPGAGHSGKDRQMTTSGTSGSTGETRRGRSGDCSTTTPRWPSTRRATRPSWCRSRPERSEQEREHARYLTAVHYIDSLFGGVVDDLERRKLLDRTVVIVTSDHGMEFDDSGLGFTGHSTAYSEYQMHTPLVVRWPGRPPGRVTRRTSHNDVAPTLMTELFGCTNPPSDYSSGHSLFSDAEWSWLIAASYSDFAVIEPDRVIMVLPAATRSATGTIASSRTRRCPGTPCARRCGR